MAQIITEPETAHVVHHVNEDNNPNSWVALVGIVFLVIISLLFYYYALPMLNRAVAPTHVNPQVYVPDKVDVNLNTNGQ